MIRIGIIGNIGSGKSYVSGRLLSGQGLKPLNSDDVYEYLAKKHNMDLGEKKGLPHGTTQCAQTDHHRGGYKTTNLHGTAGLGKSL